MFPPLPPSSKQTFLIVSAAFFEISLPARVEPVNETKLISGWLEISVPTPALPIICNFLAFKICSFNIVVPLLIIQPSISSKTRVISSIESSGL